MLSFFVPSIALSKRTGAGRSFVGPRKAMDRTDSRFGATERLRARDAAVIGNFNEAIAGSRGFCRDSLGLAEGGVAMCSVSPS